MQRRPIVSRRDPDDPRPWADLELTDGSLDVQVRELNGLPAFRARNGLGADEPPGWKRRPDATAHTFARSSDDQAAADTGVAPADEIHVLAVTLDGELEFVPTSQQQPVYYAHLAWWDPATGEWTALEFIDPTDEEPR